MAWLNFLLAAYGMRKADQAGGEVSGLYGQQMQMSQQQWQDYQERMQRWDEMYGGLEKNLAEYYSSLTPQKLATMGLEHEAKAFESAKRKITQTIAQRGLTDTGIEAGITAKAELQSAENRAKIRAEAPDKVAAIKQQFFSSREQIKQNLMRGSERSMESMSHLLGQQAARAAESEAGYFQGASRFLYAGIRDTNIPDSNNQQQDAIPGLGTGRYPMTSWGQPDLDWNGGNQ